MSIKMSTTRSTLHSLPNELFVKIFDQLSVIDRVRLRSVSKQFIILCDFSLNKITKLYLGFDSPVDDKVFSDFYSLDQIAVCKLNISNHMVTEFLLSKCGQSLQSLILENNIQRGKNSNENHAFNFANVPEMIANNCSNLTSLTFDILRVLGLGSFRNVGVSS